MLFAADGPAAVVMLAQIMAVLERALHLLISKAALVFFHLLDPPPQATENEVPSRVLTVL